LGELEGTYFGRMDSDLAIITTDANALVIDIHDRMPVILAPNDYARWLSCISRNSI
jgi:putative SOS response-associated peptidase YedK